MNKLNFHYFPRDFEAGNFVENFLVSAVSSLLIIRVFLGITGYPQIGSDDFHIAHMLWGGIIMLLTIIGLLVFLNRETKIIASITGGVGFGAFIDELGKFITRDNDYFYQPTIAMIYVIFIIIFLLARFFERYFKLTPQEYTINAMELVKNAIMHDLDKAEKQKALYLLKHSSKEDKISKILLLALKEIKAISIPKPNVFHQLEEYLKNVYLGVIRHKYFKVGIIAFFIILSITSFIGAIVNFSNTEGFADWGELIFSLVSGLVVIIGIQFLIVKTSRRRAYWMFKFSVLISIFLTQFFRFLRNELSGIYTLIAYLIVLSVLQYLMYEESLLKAKKATTSWKSL